MAPQRLRRRLPLPMEICLTCYNLENFHACQHGRMLSYGVFWFIIYVINNALYVVVHSCVVTWSCASALIDFTKHAMKNPIVSECNESNDGVCDCCELPLPACRYQVI